MNRTTSDQEGPKPVESFLFINAPSTIAPPRCGTPCNATIGTTMSYGLSQAPTAIGMYRSKTGETYLYPATVAIFFFSGFAALIYQIIWQRALFTIFGINVEAATVVVTGFLLGLGFGSVFGGWLSRTSTIPVLAIFGLIEMVIGAFGAISLHLFEWAGARTLHLTGIAVTGVTLVLVIIPTLFMGATLPILTQYFVQRVKNVGRSVGLLYSINTLGSAVACFVSALGLMHLLGMQNSVRVAAAINVLVGSTGLSLAYWRSRLNQAAPAEVHSVSEILGSFSQEEKSKLLFACIVSMLIGYVSLSYEIIWFRAFLIGTNQSQAFAIILGAYLSGLAVGSWWVGRYFAAKPHNTQLLYMLSVVILLSSVFGFSVLPLAAKVASFGGWNGFASITLFLVFAQTVISGIAFPLLCHVGFTADDKAGLHLSLVYTSNILGSTAGTLITGFILLDWLSTAQISAFLTTIGAIAAAAVAGLAPMSWSSRATFVALGIVVALCSPFAIQPLFDHYYQRLIYKDQIESKPPFADVVENKSGVVTVSTQGVVYGNGMYDGMAYVDLIDDKNYLIRPFSLPLYHPHPREVLMVGLATGAWAQVIVNNPEVERLTVVEINPGYLRLIAKYPAVMTLLTNPKVEINIDDGRRWMNRHPGRKFDAIVQNTTQNFRPNVTNLLSTEYLRLAASHLRKGGVMMYNTTGSWRAQRTGCMIFAHALRELGIMVASNEPLQLDPGRLKAVLEIYSIDGHPVFDLSNSIHRARLEEIMATVDPSALDQSGVNGEMETCLSIESRTQDQPLITDDNMGEEWQKADWQFH
jgi:spermidine synthase